MSLWNVSPVLAYECLLVARRWQTFAARIIFLFALVVSLGVAWVVRFPGFGLNRNALAAVGEAFFIALAGTQLVLVLLAAPAYLAGSICLDKARGSLTHLLVTELSSAEIVLGKLAGRGLPVLGLLLAGVPVLALTSLLGGIEPEAIFAAFAVAVAVGLVSCTLALFLSVWGDKPHEVLIAAYLVEGAWLLALPVWFWIQMGWSIGPAPDWLVWSNPFKLAFAAYGMSRASAEDYLLFCTGCLGVSVLLTLLAAVSLRPVARREHVRRAHRWHWPHGWRWGPSLDFNPVLWREWRRRLSSRWLWNVWTLYALCSIAASLVALVADSGDSRTRMAAFVNAFQFSIGLLLVGVTTVASLFEERVRGSLDVLLATPLSTPSIVRGKWWGGFRLVLQVMLLPMLLALAVFASGNGAGEQVVFLGALMLAYGALVNSLALALAVWVRHFAVALGVMVALYVLLAAGPILLLLAAPVSREMEGFACLSPWFGAGETTFLIGGHGPESHVGWKLIWLCLYYVAAVVLWRVTERTFDRCLGRVGASDGGTLSVAQSEPRALASSYPSRER
jgi:ABC-type transport system involved in multi-copper enzyme maturation permease subunit